jgi:hypothetical protein
VAMPGQIDQSHRPPGVHLVDCRPAAPGVLATALHPLHSTSSGPSAPRRKIPGPRRRGRDCSSRLRRRPHRPGFPAVARSWRK